MSPCHRGYKVKRIETGASKRRGDERQPYIDRAHEQRQPEPAADVTRPRRTSTAPIATTSPPQPMNATRPIGGFGISESNTTKDPYATQSQPTTVAWLESFAAAAPSS